MLPLQDLIDTLRYWFHTKLSLSLPKCLMEFCKVTLTFELADEIVQCDHSNESSLPVFTHGAIYFSKFYKMKFGNLVEICFWLHLAVKGLIIYHVKVLLTKFDLNGT